MGIEGGINGGNTGYIGIVTIVEYFSTLSKSYSFREGFTLYSK